MSLELSPDSPLPKTRTHGCGALCAYLMLDKQMLQDVVKKELRTVKRLELCVWLQERFKVNVQRT